MYFCSSEHKFGRKPTPSNFKFNRGLTGPSQQWEVSLLMLESLGMGKDEAGHTTTSLKTNAFVGEAQLCLEGRCFILPGPVAGRHVPVETGSRIRKVNRFL